MAEKRITAPVGSTISILLVGNGLGADAGVGMGGGGLMRIKPGELSVATTFLATLLLVATALSAIAFWDFALRYLPTQYTRICTGSR